MADKPGNVVVSGVKTIVLPVFADSGEPRFSHGVGIFHRLCVLMTRQAGDMQHCAAVFFFQGRSETQSHVKDFSCHWQFPL